MHIFIHIHAISVIQQVYTQFYPLQLVYIGFGAQKLKIMSGFNAMSQDL
jgi:hypothetical protein